ncbi:hypothetical protein DP73_19575 [Desulfosporosinus sp. HMP52]|uniref:DUF3793 family protein n=1 Tax=Desulfosporosinus sp. HMP52 TaxID=1487923 RepID=UPI00051FC2F2|nr:DUF3793 family protein [Desulfosporosinus sp. HMP52]KGK83806.1 hypothetical protein DP73_19575 [Desulfosporosinus sp. HMP52]
MDFMSLRRSIMDDKSYLYTSIAYWAAPTIAKQKPSSLIAFSHDSRDLYCLWESHKQEIAEKLHLDYLEIRKCPRRVLVIFFDRTLLMKTLSIYKNKEFLKTIGYPKKLILDEYLLLLKRHFELSCPHEVGIFLGIPLEDVLGFIKFKGKECLLNSYWKVYHNLEEAKTIFAAYDKARVEVISSLSFSEYSSCVNESLISTA